MNEDLQSLIGDGWRLLEKGETRQPGDELILPAEHWSSRFWAWSHVIDSPVQGEPGQCYACRRKIETQEQKGF